MMETIESVSLKKKDMVLKPKTKAALYMVLAALAFSLTAVAVKSLPSDIPTEQKLVSRSLVALLVTSVLIFFRKKSRLKPGNAKLLLLRSLFGVVAMFCYFTAISGLPLSEAVTLNHLSPFFVAFFAAFFLGEKFTKMQVVAVVFAFLGSLMVLRPGLVSFSLAAALGVLSAALAGGAYTTLRALRKYDTPETIVFWFSAFMLLIALPPTLLRGRVPNVSETLLLVALGCGGVIGQLSVTAAYRHAPGGEVAIYNYLGVAFSMIWQVGLFVQPLEPLPLVGAGVIVFGAYLNWRSNKSKAKQDKGLEPKDEGG